MDIHRCRFVPYPPSTINAIAFSHSHISQDQKTAPPRLAIGRANGDIEIWNPLMGSWLQETIIRGGKDRSIDGLVWTQDPTEEDANDRTIIGKSRLFSIGYTTTVTEWDLEKGRPLRQTSGNHGEIWCLAAQPPLKLEGKKKTTTQWSGQNLITGCTDGAVVLYSTQDKDLQLQRVLVRPSVKKAKILSVVFQNRNIVIAGCTDSTIRVYDIRNGIMLRSMSLGSGPAGGPKEIIVWSVKALQNGVIISGDSTGEVRIWDGKTYTLMQRIKGHRQDVLSLATSHDGSTIFSGGMDRRTVVYKQFGKGKPRFAEVAHRRYHSHDVKTMATLEGRGMSVVVSGGPDASPVVLPLGQFGMENQRALPFLSQDPPLISSPSQRLLMSYWDREIHIWRLLKPSEPSTDDEEETDQAARNRKLVAKILIKGEESITSASINLDGSILAVSTAAHIKIFHLRPRSSDNSQILKISKVTVPKALSTGARLVRFSRDGKWLCIIRNDNRIHLARVTWPSTPPTSPKFHTHLTKLERIDRRIEKHVLLGGLGAYNRNITQAAFSSDGRILVVSDLAGYIDAFVLSGHEDLTQSSPEDNSDAASSSESSDSDDTDDDNEKIHLVYGQHWTRNPTATSLPKLPSTPVILSFRPTTKRFKAITNGLSPHPTRHNPHPVSHVLPTSDTTEDRLLVLTATSDFFEFDVLKGSLSDWSRHNPTSRFPEEFRQIRDQPRGCVWDVSDSKERVWLYGVGWLWMFDLSRDLPEPTVGQETNGSRLNGLKTAILPNKSLTNTSLSKKRKRNGKEFTSGAGSSIPDQKLITGISRTMQRTIHEEVDQLFPLSATQNDPTAMQLDDDDDNFDDEWVLPRESPKQAGGNGSGDSEVENGTGNVEGRPHHWHTFKYRPILGIVPIGMGSDLGPEVAVVERPAWEAELPERFYGDQEWVKGDVV